MAHIATNLEHGRGGTSRSSGLFFGGHEIETREWSKVIDPAAPGETVGLAPVATRGQAKEAVAAADRAFRHWGALGAGRRAAMLADALDVLDQGFAERAELLVRENGKVRAEAEVELRIFRRRCELAARLADEVVGSGMPLGVVTIIVPYSWPLAILAASLPYALVAGNTVIVEPPPTCPLALVETIDRLAAELPPGVLNVVAGPNEAVEPLVRHPRIRKIVFTGTTKAAASLSRAAAENLSRLTLDVGGNDAAIVLDDATLDAEALARLVTASFLAAGQVPAGIKRIYVHRSRYAELVDGMSAVLDRYVVGHGLAPETTMGPLNNARQRDFVVELLGEARADGAEIRELGRLTEQAEREGGFFLRPALVLDPKPDLRIVTEDQFGPALPICRYDDEGALVDRLNGEWAGAGSSIWTSDRDRADDLAGRLRTATTWVNHASAVGRELGALGVLDFTELHAVIYPA